MPDDVLCSGSRSALRRVDEAEIPGPAYLKAGIRPNRRPESSETARVNASARESMAISSRRGRVAGPCATRKRSPAWASPSPSTPPSSPSTTLSMSSPRTIRPRPAPSAARTASSCCRPSALTSNRLATLAHAITITMPIVPISTHRAPATLPTTSCFERTKRRRDAPALVDPWIDARGRRPRAHPDRHHPRDVGAGLRDRHARLQPGDGLKAEAWKRHAGCDRRRAAGSRRDEQRRRGIPRASRRRSPVVANRR